MEVSDRSAKKPQRKGKYFCLVLSYKIRAPNARALHQLARAIVNLEGDIKPTYRVEVSKRGKLVFTIALCRFTKKNKEPSRQK